MWTKIGKRKVILKKHAVIRLGQHRQRGITLADVFRACESAALGNSIPEKMELGPFVSKDGTIFSVVVADSPTNTDLHVITIIGQWKHKDRRVKRRANKGILRGEQKDSTKRQRRFSAS